MNKQFLQLAIVAAAYAGVYGNPCGSGDWKYNPGTNACYKLISDILPWTVAEFKCLFQGAHHVSVHSIEENKFVNEVSQHREIWIGSAYFGRNAVYVNSDQSTYGNFENWIGDKRPTMNRARRCIKMDRSGNWFQSCCKKRTSTVCKKPALSRPDHSQEWRRAKFYRR
ncbi:unnamed protein product [Auanema sp. JU1783]|nr:unnamed protein product [Auanema sp. JU1783]